MALNFLLIGHREESLWFQNLEKALVALGKLQVLSMEEAMLNILQNQYDMIIIDKVFVEKEILLISHIRARQPDTRILVVTSTPTWRQIRDVLKAGAMDYLSKSMSEREYLSTFENVLAKHPPAWNQ